MKKTPCLTALLLFFFGISQSIYAEYGIRVGLNYSSIAGDVYFDKWKWGPQIGLFRDFMLKDRWGLQVEVDYTSKGTIYTQFMTEQNSPTITGKVENVVLFQYIEMPVLIKYIPHIANNCIGLLVGVHASYLIDAYDKQNDVDDLGVKEMKFDLRPATNKIDYGLILGMEYDFLLFRAPLFLDVRYNLGLRAVFKESEDWKDGHHSLFSFSLGIRF